MICNKCGAPNPDDSRFCGSCGRELVQPAPAVAAAPPGFNSAPIGARGSRRAALAKSPGATSDRSRSTGTSAPPQQRQARAAPAGHTASTNEQSRGPRAEHQSRKPGPVAQSTHVGDPSATQQPAHSAAEELAALKANIAHEAAAQRSRYTGWKPLTIWYVCWAVFVGAVSLKALTSGAVGTFVVGAIVTGLLGLYARYLYGGGTRRVWFMIF